MNELREMLCPNCGRKIPYDVEGLLLGRVYICSNCNVKVSLCKDSEDTLKNAYEQFEKIKNNK